ncbi:MAG: glycosyltransferase [Bryobacterales bacterium]|nr:glycosyltransferase [Bryobacterales bacterium]
MENRLVLDSGERLETIPGAPVAGRSAIARVGAIYALARGVAWGRALLRREGTQLVIGFGSYAASGACLAAWSLGIPVVIHEANAAFGRANRLLLPFSQGVCVAFDGFRNERVVRTGTPCRPTAAWIPAADGRLRVLVIGGSQGSSHLHQEAPKLLAAVNQSRCLRVVHLTGEFDPAGVERLYRGVGVEARVEKFSYAMPALYAQTDFVVACAGGGCLAEIANQELPALLVPLSRAAENHQVDNAREFSLKTGCLWAREEEWDAAEQARRIVALLDNPEALDELKARTAQWGLQDATLRIIRVCEELLG